MARRKHMQVLCSGTALVVSSTFAAAGDCQTSKSDLRPHAQLQREIVCQRRVQRRPSSTIFTSWIIQKSLAIGPNEAHESKIFLASGGWGVNPRTPRSLRSPQINPDARQICVTDDTLLLTRPNHLEIENKSRMRNFSEGTPLVRSPVRNRPFSKIGEHGPPPARV